MAESPVFLRRLRKAIDAVALLSLNPGQGRTVADLAAEVGVKPTELQQSLADLYAVDLPVGNGVDWIRPTLEFSSVEDPDDEPELLDTPPQRLLVKAVSSEPLADLGITLVTPSQAVALRTVADRMGLDGDDAAVLTSALAKVEQALGTADLGADPTEADAADARLGLLREAVEQRRRVRIRYAASFWKQETEREVEPLALAWVDGDWELDAGPVRGEDLRSFLVDHIRSVELLDETFTRTEQMEALLLRRRETVTVRLVVPAERLWLLPGAVSAVTLVRSDGEDVEVDVVVREPVPQRLGRLLCALGPAAFVVSPPGLVRAGEATARQLLRAWAPAED